MVARKGAPQKLRENPDAVRERIAVWEQNDRNVTATARALGVTRRAVRNTLDAAKELGLITVEDYDPDRGINAPRRDAYLSARARKQGEYLRAKAKGGWRKPVLVNIPDRPFILKVFGDPHMDDPGFNIDLFEKHWLEMDAQNGIYGVCVGDFFNNWIRALGHLYQHQGDPSDAWTVFEYLMAERPGALLAACSGNHDDWSKVPAAAADPIYMVMRQYGVRYRVGAIRLVLGADNPITIGMRHKWQGRSMYSAAHGLYRGAEKGWSDDILIGGHIHQDEIRDYVHPDTKNISKLVQISAFKDFDEHADVQGYMGPKISPVLNLVIDKRAPKNDPDRVKPYWSTERAMAELERLRCAS